MDDLIAILAVVLITGISTLIQKLKKDRPEEESSDHPLSPGAPHRQTPPRIPGGQVQPLPQRRAVQEPERPRRPARDWEKEIRKLLGGDTPPAVERPPMGTPALGPARPGPAARPPLLTTRSGADEGDLKEGPVRTIKSMAQSTEAYDRASHLHEHAAARLRQVVARTRSHEKVADAKPQRTPAALSQAIEMVRNPQTARAAMVVSIIIGPPRGLD